MAESQDDKNVDTAIDRMQALLDELKGAQAKDVQDESGEEADEQPPARSIQEAEQRAYVKVRAHIRARKQQAI